MDQGNGNIKVKIDNMVNCIILQVIINSGSQSLLYEKEETKLSIADIDKILRENLSAISVDDSQLPFPDYDNNGLSFSPANDCLKAFQYFKEEAIQMYKNKACLINEFHAACESYFRDQYKKKGIRRFCKDYKMKYIINRRNEIDNWLFAQWANEKHPLESIRLLVERLSLYCKNKVQEIYAYSCETQKRMEENTMPEIEALTQQWKNLNIITRSFKGKKIFDTYASTLSDYYLQQLQIKSNDCLSYFFSIVKKMELEKLQITVNSIYDILNEKDKQFTHLFLGKDIFSELVPIIEKAHLSLSDIGMNTMTEVLDSLQQASYPEGNERMQNLREELSRILIDRYLYQLMTEYELTFDVVTDDSGVEYTPDRRILLKAPKKLNSYYVPDGVATILDSAFADVTSLEYIKIPEGVCSIGKSAFQGCSNLKEIILPKSVIQIGDHAFRGCTQLEDVVFLYRNISLNDELFEDCPALKKERIMTYNSVIAGWTFDIEKSAGIHKETGIELRYCFDNEDGTIKTELVNFMAHMKALRTQGYSQEEVDATFRRVGREFVILCKSLY